MREERGQIRGDLVVHEPYNLWGTVAGNVRVVQNGKLYVRGAIYGDLEVEYGGRVHIFGNVSGNLTVEDGAKVIHSGVLGGDLKNNGARVYVEGAATVSGKIKTKKGGVTVVEPGARVADKQRPE